LRDKIKILDVYIDRLDMAGAVAEVKSLLNQDGASLIVTPNSEMLAMAAENPELADILNSADLAAADGMGLLLAAKIMGDFLPERVAGYDLIRKLFSELEDQPYSFYLLGAEPGIVDKAESELKKSYPALNIVGTHHGYLDRDKLEKVIAEINEKKVDLLLVGMGVPLQERFLDNNLGRLDVKAAVTVGGSFDVIAGKVKRAPLWMQKSGLEWFYRLLKEPSRFGRMLLLPKFLYLVFKQNFFKRS